MAEHSWNDQKGFNRFGLVSTLTPQQKDEIGKRRYNGEKAIDLAAEYGVRRNVINNISLIEN